VRYYKLRSKTTNGKSIVIGINASNGERLFVYDGSKNVQGKDSINKDASLKIVCQELTKLAMQELSGEYLLFQMAYSSGSMQKQAEF
jgi:hypothetical protein